MRATLSGLALLLLTGCAASGTAMRYGAHDYAPTSSSDVLVLEAAPEGATLIGRVTGAEGIADSALDDARKLAAEMGADAIVVTARGTDTWPMDAFARRRDIVNADAYRLAK